MSAARPANAASKGRTVEEHADATARRPAAFAAALVGVVIGVGLTGRTSQAQEIAPFRITGVDGYVLVGGLWDDHNTTRRAGATGMAESSETQATLRQEVFLMTHGYVYHPALVAFDLGGGPVYDDGWYRTAGETTHSGELLYNLVGRANFLTGKPYTGGVYYEHLNPTQSVGPAEILLTQNESYGANFALLDPLTPVPLNVEARRTTVTGSSPLQVIDDRIDELTVALSRSFGKYGDTRASYTGGRQHSESGSTGLPILPSDSNRNDFGLDTRLTFGDRRQYDVSNFIMFNDQETTSGVDQYFRTKVSRFDLDLRGRPSDGIDTYARYGFSNDEQTSPAEQGSTDPWFVQTTRTNTVNAGVSDRLTAALFGSFDATGQWSDGTDIDSSGNSFDGRLEYTVALPRGELVLNYGLGYSQRDQESRLPVGQVIGERTVLSGTARVSLNRPLVVPGSVTVSNVDRTQTYVDGVDYRLTVVGLTTFIERTVGGSIVNGQEVLVDYSFDTGGTYKLDELRNSASLTWNLGNLASAWVRYYDSSPDLIEGAPTFELNPVTTWAYGTRVDVPLPGFSGQWLVGAYAEYEDRQEVIAPGTRGLYELYTEFPLPWLPNGGVRVGMRQGNVRYDLEPLQDMDQRSFDLRLWTVLRRGLQLTLEGTHQTDTGPQTDRTYDYVSARAVWQIRRVTLLGELRHTLESQSFIDDERTVARVGLRRDF